MWLFPEQPRLRFVPVLHHLQRGLADKECLLQLLILESQIAVQRGFQFLTRPEVLALQDLFDPSVKALDYAVGLAMLRRGHTVFDAEVGAELVERVLTCCGAFAQAEQAVGEFAALSREKPPRTLPCRSDGPVRRADTLKPSHEFPSKNLEGPLFSAARRSTPAPRARWPAPIWCQAGGRSFLQKLCR